ncbi:MAG: tRNA dihydrouridine synthase DusB [Spartobacteria bacterium]|nr:tRNA dihydrouridine synthase DusB [Spartobacteria bacterium]
MKKNENKTSILAPLTIGTLRLEHPVFLAPMAGYTHFPFRTICREFHCGMTFTEMVMVEGITRLCPQTMHYLETRPGENPIGAHIYGQNPDSIAKAAEIIEKTGRFDVVDLNCGCPVRKIRRKGAGVSLMKDPEHLYKIVKGMTERVSMPVTVKTRLGLTPECINIAEIAHAVEEAGASALFLHARTADAVHGGPANWEKLAAVKAQLSIPVIGNGGVDCAQDAVEMVLQTGVDGVMLARAAVGNPWIFEEIYCLLHGQPFVAPTREERRAVIAEHFERELALMHIEDAFRKRRKHSTEHAACGKFRAQLVRYVRGTPDLRLLIRTLNTVQSPEDVMHMVDTAFAWQAEVEKNA